jgi:hypothetical protein
VELAELGQNHHIDSAGNRSLVHRDIALDRLGRSGCKPFNKSHTIGLRSVHVGARQ